MSYFDSLKKWIILRPSGSVLSKFAAAELSEALSKLRRADTPSITTMETVPVMDAQADSGIDDRPIILLNIGSHPSNESSYAWRSADERIEIYGDSPQGLVRGVYDFLGALGFGWKIPGGSATLVPNESGLYKLSRTKGHKKAREEIKKLCIDTQSLIQHGDAWVLWALQNKIDALVLEIRFSLLEQVREYFLRRKAGFIETAKKFDLNLEEASFSFSNLIPRRFFWKNKELFRMYQGKRKADFNFCPTNPETIVLLKKRARMFFKERRWAGVFHIWPDENEGGAWCSCPSCRAFSPDEQALIVANALADTLLELDPKAKVSYLKGDDEIIGIKPRPTLLPLTRSEWETWSKN